MMMLSEHTYKEFFEQDTQLRALLDIFEDGKDRRSGAHAYIKLVLLENKPPLVALKEVQRLYKLYKECRKKSIITSYCEVCGCDPCDCDDWNRSSQ